MNKCEYDEGCGEVGQPGETPLLEARPVLRLACLGEIVIDPREVVKNGDRSDDITADRPLPAIGRDEQRFGRCDSPEFSPDKPNSAPLPLDAASRQSPLCDRERESDQLRQVFGRCCFTPSDSVLSEDQALSLSGAAGGELALVTGPSGCGKTCLVESVVHSALRVMIRGKFDQLERREQYYAIVQALTEYALIISRDSSSLQLQRVRSALSPHRETVKIVAELVPELQTLLDFEETTGKEASQQDTRKGTPTTTTSESSPEGGALARERLQLGLRRFFSSICSADDPVVLFLDDLQWAEPASLDLLASLLNHRIPGLAVVGACRDNEVDPASYLCAILRQLEANSVTITQVIVSNVSQTALDSALGNSFGKGAAKASALARILFDHTAGNMFFATQLVRYLVGEGVLHKRTDSPLWTFDSEKRVREAIRAATDAVSLLAIVIRKQEQEVWDVLLVASCLGAEFSELALRAAVVFDVSQALQVAERAAFVKRSVHDPQTWRFVHDRIQESAYSLIPFHEREQVHLQIGQNLWSGLAEHDLDVHSHVVVKQLRLGVRLITDSAERELLATLLLRVGEKAARRSEHGTAQEYVSLGIKMLERRHWRDQYTLSLALYNAASEIEYCLGNFDRMDGLVGVIMDNARSTKDKTRAQTVRIYALGTRNELDEAIDVGLAALKDFFGERLPAKPSAVSILIEYAKTKRLIRGHTDESLLSLPALDDAQTFASIRIMCLLMVYSALCRLELVPILAMRIVQHSLRRGLCGMASTGFACFGMVLNMFFNDVNSGIRFGTVALRIVDKFDAMDQLARASTVAHCFCLANTEPLPTLIPPLRLAHRAGLGSGDIEHSLMAAGLCAMVAVHSSRPLAALSSDVSSFLTLAAMYRHSGTELLFRPVAQLIECLRGEAPDPSELNGTYVQWKPALRVAKQTNHGAAISMILTCKLMLESLFRRGEQAEASAAELDVRGNGMETAPIFMKAAIWLHQGLASLAQAHKDGIVVRRRIRRARQCCRKLEALARDSESNYGGKALLLRAELTAARGLSSRPQALLQYGAAISVATKAEAWSDAGLACERLSAALQATGRSDEALLYLNQAAKCYEMWGATAKVTELQASIVRPSSPVRGRERVS